MVTEGEYKNFIEKSINEYIDKYLINNKEIFNYVDINKDVNDYFLNNYINIFDEKLLKDVFNFARYLHKTNNPKL